MKASSEKTKSEEAQVQIRMEDLVVAFPDGMAVFDVSQRAYLSNAALTTMIGLPVNNFSLAEFIRLIPAPYQLTAEKIDLVFKRGEVIHLPEVSFFRFWYELFLIPLYRNDDIFGAMLALRDITKERELDRSKTEFISISSHQLRTPVSALNWLTEALLFNSKDLSPKQKKYLGDLSSMTKRLVKLVEDLLDMSRIELKTGVAAEKNQIEIFSFVEKFIREMETYAVSKNHSIVLEKEGFKPTNMEINTKALNNILQNLLSNAIEYSPSNTAVTVVLENIEGAVKVLIYNKGPVIPKEEQLHLFGRFYRGESAKKVKTEGTGLGLYIVKNEIENIGGKVGFESVEGKDTVFWFTLPLKSAGKS